MRTQPRAMFGRSLRNFKLTWNKKEKQSFKTPIFVLYLCRGLALVGCPQIAWKRSFFMGNTFWYTHNIYRKNVQSHQIGFWSEKISRAKIRGRIETWKEKWGNAEAERERRGLKAGYTKKHRPVPLPGCHALLAGGGSGKIKIIWLCKHLLFSKENRVKNLTHCFKTVTTKPWIERGTSKET